MTKDEIQAWLLNYVVPAEEQLRVVDCIMSQDGWKYLELHREQLRAQASGEETHLEEQIDGYVLSGLYECHDGPHLATCPRA